MPAASAQRHAGAQDIECSTVQRSFSATPFLGSGCEGTSSSPTTSKKTTSWFWDSEDLVRCSRPPRRLSTAPARDGGCTYVAVPTADIHREDEDRASSKLMFLSELTQGTEYVSEDEDSALDGSPKGDFADLESPQCWGERGERWRQVVKIAIEDPASGPKAMTLQYLMMGLIFTSVAFAIIETVPRAAGHVLFLVSEPIFTALFSLEIICRFWTRDTFQAFFGNVFNIIDILATSPGYVDLGLFFLLDSARRTGYQRQEVEDLSHSFNTLRLADMLQIVRLLRILRVAKAMKQFEAITIVVRSVYGSLTGLAVLFAFVAVGTVLAATAAYCFEAPPSDMLAELEDEQGQFTSIPSSIWWAASTIMAVGYGDIVPHTIGGKIVAMITMFGGTVIMAVCIAIITNSFNDLYQRNRYAARVRGMQQKVKQSHERRCSISEQGQGSTKRQRYRHTVSGALPGPIFHQGSDDRIGSLPLQWNSEAHVFTSKDGADEQSDVSVPPRRSGCVDDGRSRGFGMAPSGSSVVPNVELRNQNSPPSFHSRRRSAPNVTLDLADSPEAAVASGAQPDSGGGAGVAGALDMAGQIQAAPSGSGNCHETRRARFAGVVSPSSAVGGSIAEALDLATTVNNLEETTEDILIALQALTGSLVQDPDDRSGAARRRIANLTLDMLRKSSKAWFEQCRLFSEELLSCASESEFVFEEAMCSTANAAD